MSLHGPMRRFLGLEASADPLQVLGLEPDQLDRNSILAARDRIEHEIDEHPDGDSQEAEAVKAHVRDAATVLLDSASRLETLARHIPEDVRDTDRMHSGSLTEITHFDRQVLGILTASGGWNSESRARLMMIAAQHGVAPQQLMNVLMGMTQWLRSGGAVQVPRRDGKAGFSSSLPASFEAVRTEGNAEAFDRFVERWTPDFRSEDTASVARLSILFAGIVILLLILIVGFLLSTPTPRLEEMAGVNESASLNSGSTLLSTEPEDGQIAVMDELADRQVQSLPLPSSMIDASDGIVASTIGMELLNEAVERGEPASNTTVTFQELIRVSGLGWFLSDPRQLESLIQSVNGVFENLGEDLVLAKSLIATLDIKEVDEERIEYIPESAFHAGVLGSIKVNRRISPSVRDDVNRILSSRGITDLRGDGFSAASAKWLNQLSDHLIRSSSIGQVDELKWYVWIQCVLSLPQEEDVTATLLGAVEQFIREGLQIDQDVPARHSLVRILEEIDFFRSELSREFLIRLYMDETLDSHRLAVLTGIISKVSPASWFDESLRVGRGDDSRTRKLLAKRLASKWPEQNKLQTRRPIRVPRGFSPGLASIWLDDWDALQAVQPRASEIAMLTVLLELRFFNQSAAAMVGGDSSRARSIMKQMKDDFLSSTLDSRPDEPPVSTRAWGRRMSKARTIDEKRELLNELDRYGSGDLDYIDAAALSDLALKAPSRIRNISQNLIEQRFLKDPELILALVDNLPRKPSQDVADFLSVVTGMMLPDVQDPRWPWETRKLLVNMAMELRADNADNIEILASTFHKSILEEIQDEISYDSDQNLTTDQALAFLGEARADRIRSVMSVYDSKQLSAMLQTHEERFRLAEGPLQKSLVRSLALLDLMVLEWSIRMPDELEDFEWIQEDLNYRLPLSSHVLMQLVLVEHAIGDIWQIVIKDYRNRSRDSEATPG